MKQIFVHCREASMFPSRMGFFNYRRSLLIPAMTVLVVTLMLIAIVVNGRITTWINSEGFNQMLDRATSKGLKLEGHYTPLHRVGLFGLAGDSFTGTKGAKTIVILQANTFSATFNPLGLATHVWELDDLHVNSGTVMLQKTEGTPGAHAPPLIPWWGFFWPYRVYLEDVKVDDANILWQLKEKESGIYHTFLEITPNGRDFEYDARGGAFKTPLSPDLAVRHLHLLIRKPRLYCSEFVLGDDPAHPDRGVRAEGDAGLQEDRSISMKADLNSLNVSPWMPEKLRAHVVGWASGHLDYTSSSTGLQTAQGQGSITIAKGVLHNLAAIHQYAKITGSPDPGDLTLSVCQSDVIWKQGAITIQNLKVECAGVFRLEGSATMAPDRTLGGSFEFGLTNAYLRWLPTARQAIFTRDDGPYHFTTIQLSGTAEKPVQDLSPRIAKEVEKSPLLAMKLFFNAASDWFNFD